MITEGGQMRFEHLHMSLREEIILKKTWKAILILLAILLFSCIWKYFYYKTQTQTKRFKSTENVEEETKVPIS